ncbi:MAG TPA: ABC transporter ATP-binding protein [Acidimicrobiales bacterium]|nr:ABC transporter ATP-binding protein [Acidimicrobiales bacterium]
MAWARTGAAVTDDDRIGRDEAGAVLRRTLEMLRPYRRGLLAAVAVLVVYTASLEAGPLIVGVVVNHGLVGGHRSARVVEVGAIAYISVAMVMGVAERAQILMVNRVGESFLRDLRIRVFDHILSLSMPFFDREQTGRLVARMTSDIDALEMLVQQGLLVFVTSALLFSTVLVVMAVLSPLLFVVTLVVVPPVVVSSQRFRRDSNAAYLVVRDRIGQTLSALQESLAGVRVVQAFGREREQHERFRARNEAQYEANVHAVRISARYFPTVELASVAATAIIVVVGGLMVHAHLTQVGTVTSFILYLGLLIDPIQQVSQLFNLVQQSGAALHKLYGLLDVAPDVAERRGALDLPRGGDLVVAEVGFRYRPDLDPVLDDVTIAVPHGSRLALVGPTGAGKSTLAKLMARFYDPTDGRVTYGGVDLRDATLASLRRRVVVVPQEGFLFHGTLLDNVRIAAPGASDDDVRQALRTIGAEARFDALPDGLLTEVRERGSRLSAGERQLVSLARAALADPDVLILDEATSNLDPGTEADVEVAMGALMHGRTVIVIAHRLSTAQRADAVAVVDAGGVVEHGSHDQLVARGGPYAALFAVWAGAPTG